MNVSIRGPTPLAAAPTALPLSSTSLPCPPYFPSSRSLHDGTNLSGVEETVSGGLREVDLEGELDGLGLGGSGLGGHGY